MLRYRLLLGPVLIALLVGAAWLDEYLLRTQGHAALVIAPLLLVVCALGARELTVILHRRSIFVGPRLTMAGAVLGMIASGLVAPNHAGVSGIALVCTASVGIMLVSFLYYARHQTAEGVAAAVSGTMMAFVYLGIMGGFLIALRKEHSAWLVLGILLVTKSYDIGAYFTGRILGRHKMILWLSPGKTWEGLAGGLITSTLIAIACVAIADQYKLAYANDLHIELWQAGVIGLLFGLFGQAGDLIASLLKRDAGLKDSSRVLPGFGGVLDVIDSPLVVAPVAYWAFWGLQALSQQG